MSILNKTLDSTALHTLDLFLNGALAPLAGYLSREDHISVLQSNRLANGMLWPLPLALELSAAEKLQAQLAGRIALLDDERRILAEVEVDNIYRLPQEVAELTDKTVDTWYVSGAINANAKVLHPAFNRLRHTAPTLNQHLNKNFGWQNVIAVHSDAAELDTQAMQQACNWLKSSPEQQGGILLQISADDSYPLLHDNMRDIRAKIRCNAAKQVKISLLPALLSLSEQRRVLLQALIARNFGATGFVISATTHRTTQRWLLRHRDEIGLALLPPKRSQSAQQISRHENPQTLRRAA